MDDIIKDLETLCPNHSHAFEVCSDGGPWSVQCIAHYAIDEIRKLRSLLEIINTMHQPHIERVEYCQCCGYPWPCMTARLFQLEENKGLL